MAEVLKKLVAIAPIHCHLFIKEMVGSMQNLTNLARDELRMFGELEKALLTTSSTDGAAIGELEKALALSELKAIRSRARRQTIWYQTLICLK